MEIGRSPGKTSARWKNVLTAYARLEIGERLCKTWLAHFKCRNAKPHRRSRIVLLSRDGSQPPPPLPPRVRRSCRMQEYLHSPETRFIRSRLWYFVLRRSRESSVETKILFRKERFLTRHRYDIFTRHGYYMFLLHLYVLKYSYFVSTRIYICYKIT